MSPDLITAFREFLWAGTVWNDHNFNYDQVAEKAQAACRAAGIQTPEEANDLLERLAEEQTKMEALEELVAADRNEIGSYGSNKGLRGQTARLNERLERAQALLAKVPRVATNAGKHDLSIFLGQYRRWLETLDTP
jgi:hypothetical protein